MDNLNRTLIPENYNGGTRFPLPVLADSTFKKTLKLLVKEFKDELCEVKNSSLYTKLYFTDKIIEINRNYVVFIPQLLPATAEDIRKRIFKNIASKPSVYQQTSIDNFILSKRALVEGDLRVSVSLLYYSIHKAINSLQQRILEDNFESKINDNIKFEELGHFTDVLFYKDYDKYDEVIKQFNECIEDKNNIKKLGTTLCRYSKFGVNPFRMISIITDTVSFNNISLYENVINCLAKTIISNLDPQKMADTQEIYDIVEQILDKEFQATLESNGSISTQEKRVNIAILKAIHLGWQSNEIKYKIRYYIMAIFLRLYWLRQTADYAFDFEVKTSYKEVSLHIFVCEWLLNSLFNYTNNPEKSDNLKENKENDNVVSEININGNIIENCKNNDIIEYVDSEISNDIISGSKETIYIKAIWQDSNFDYQKLMLSIYQITGVHTEENDIIYNAQKSIFNIDQVKICISNDCVILFKICIPHYLLDLLIIEEVKQIIFNLLINLINNYCNINNCDSGSIKILLSKPLLNHKFSMKYLENRESTALDSYNIFRYKLMNISDAINDKIKILLKSEKFLPFTRRIRFGTGEEDYFEVTNPAIYKNSNSNILFIFNVRPIVDGNELINLENEKLFIGFPQSESNFYENCFQICFNIILFNDNILQYTKSIENIEGYINNIFSNFNSNNNSLEHKLYTVPILAYTQDVDSLSIDKLKIKIIEEINSVAYMLIKDLELNYSDGLLRFCEEIAEDVYVTATRGLWYYYNNTLSVDDRMENGEKKYLEAIELAQKTDFRYTDSLIQRYYIEKARIIAENNLIVDAYKLLQNENCLNPNAMFYDEVIEMIKLYGGIMKEVTEEIIEEAALSQKE